MTLTMSSRVLKEPSLRLDLLVVLLLWAGLFLLIGSPQQSLMAHDEGYYAQQARWILANQDWITVGWWGEPVFDRTIGLQWLIALSYSIFGRSEWAARLPTALASLGAVLLTWRLGERFGGNKVGWWGAAILVVTPIWAQASRLAMQDILLVFLELLGIWALLRLEETGQRWRWGLLAGTVVGLGFLVKSVMVVLPVVAILPYLIQHRRIHLTNPALYGGLVLGFIPAGIWLWLSVQRYGWLPLQQLFGKVLHLSQVSAGSTYYTATSPGFYLWNIPANTFPWSLFAIAGVVIALRSARFTRGWLWLGYPLILLVALTIFDTRTWYYPLQLYPFLAMYAALALHSLTKRYGAPSRFQRRLPVRLSWVLGAVALLLLGAGGVLLSAPAWGIDPALRPYGWIGIGGGIGWLVPLIVMLQDGETRWNQRGWLWQTGWLLGPGLAVAAVFLTGLWGNYSADVKTALNGAPVDAILGNHRIHFVQPGADATSVLLTYYTRQLGDPLDNWNQMPAGAYAWAPQAPLPDELEAVATLRDRQLIQRSN